MGITLSNLYLCILDSVHGFSESWHNLSSLNRTGWLHSNSTDWIDPGECGSITPEYAKVMSEAIKNSSLDFILRVKFL